MRKRFEARSGKAPRITPNRLWLGIFAVWLLFLSGLPALWGGSPGFTQAIRLKALLADRTNRMAGLEAEIARIETESELLEKSRVAQEREIRRTLGYAGTDEIIFDFSSAERTPAVKNAF